MSKLETLQAELNRLNVEILTDVGVTLRKKQQRINVIILAIARITGTVLGGTPGPIGLTGEKGEKGANGTNGSDGLRGLRGEKGNDAQIDANFNVDQSYKIANSPILTRHGEFWSYVHDWSGNIAVQMGGENDPANYYNNSRHAFRDRSGVLLAEISPLGFTNVIMTTIQRDAIVTPSEGLEIYNITTHSKEYFNGTIWKSI